ncbi:MAG: outer membrane beta-barrel protein, partial [Bacteroidales bacterium]|nr:outer membrane beta-barrel protein [Bacteroidales bacterium]
MFRRSIILLLLLAPVILSAQKAKPKNDSNYDERMLHFGFSMGLNTMDFNIKLSEEAVANGITAETVSLKPGINIQIVSDFRPTTYLDVRFLPGVSFGQRNINFYQNGVLINDKQKLEYLKDLKNNRRGRIQEYVQKYPKAVYHTSEASADYNPLWNIKADCAFPCATQNEINEKDANNLVKNGIRLLGEGANMPVSIEGIHILQDNGIMYAPGKASNAGGVGTSGLEMTQNFMGVNWSREEVDKQLQHIMKTIHDTCLAVANEYGKPGNYLVGANIAGFLKVANA